MRRNYNELVIDDVAWKSHLPGAIDAVFFYEEGSRDHARHVRDAFAREFGLTEAQVPLLRMHVNGNALDDHPFSLAH